MSSLNLFLVFDNRLGRSCNNCGADVDIFMAARKTFIHQIMELISLAKLDHSTLFEINVHLSILYKNHFEVILPETLLSNHDTSCTNNLTILHAFQKLEQTPPTIIHESKSEHFLSVARLHTPTQASHSHNNLRIFYTLLNSLTQNFAHIRNKHERLNDNELATSHTCLCIFSCCISHSILYNSFVRLCSSTIPFTLRGIVIDSDAMCVTSVCIAKCGKLWRCPVHEHNIREAVQSALVPFLLEESFVVNSEQNHSPHITQKVSLLSSASTSYERANSNSSNSSNRNVVYTTLHVGSYTCHVKAQRSFLSWLRCTCQINDFADLSRRNAKLCIVGSELREVSECDWQTEHLSSQMPLEHEPSESSFHEVTQLQKACAEFTGLVLTRVIDPREFDETYLWGENWILTDNITENKLISNSCCTPSSEKESVNLLDNDNNNNVLYGHVTLSELHRIFANDVLLFRNYNSTLCLGEHRFTLSPSFCVAYFVTNTLTNNLKNNNNNSNNNNSNNECYHNDKVYEEHKLLLRHVIPPELRRAGDFANAQTRLHKRWLTHSESANTQVEEMKVERLKQCRSQLWFSSLSSGTNSLNELMRSNLCELVSNVHYLANVETTHIK